MTTSRDSLGFNPQDPEESLINPPLQPPRTPQERFNYLVDNVNLLGDPSLPPEAEMPPEPEGPSLLATAVSSVLYDNPFMPNRSFGDFYTGYGNNVSDLGNPDVLYGDLKGFDQFKENEGTIYENYPDAFIYDTNPAQLGASRRRVDQLLESQKTFNAASWYNQLGGSVLGGATNPVNVWFLSNSIKAGGGVLKISGRTALYQGVAESLNESILQETNPLRTAEESVQNIAAATVLGGILGAGAGVAVKYLGNTAEMEKEIIEGFTEPMPTQDQLLQRLTADIREKPEILDDDDFASSSLSAARVPLAEKIAFNQERIANLDEGTRQISTAKAGEATQKLTPNGRLKYSKFRVARDIQSKLNQATGYTRFNDLGVRNPDNVELKTSIYQGALYESVPEVKKLYVQFKKEKRNINGSTKYEDFLDAAGVAAFSKNDPNIDPLVKKAASVISKNIFVRLGEEAVQAGVMTPQTFKRMSKNGYFPVVLDAKKVQDNPIKFKGIVRDKFSKDWPLRYKKALEKAQKNKDAEFARILKNPKKLEQYKKDMGILNETNKYWRAEYKKIKAAGGKIQGPVRDTRVYKSVKDFINARLESKIDTVKVEYDAANNGARYIEKGVEEHYRSVVGLKDGVIRSDSFRGGSTRFMARKLYTDPIVIRDFMDTNIIRVAGKYINSVGPDIQIKSIFGSLDLREQLQDLAEEAAELEANAKTLRKKNAISKQYKQTRDDIEASIQLQRGTYNKGDTAQLWQDMAYVAKIWHYVRMLGGVGPSQLVELSQAMIRFGPINFMRYGVYPKFFGSFVVGSKLSRGVRNEVRLTGRVLNVAGRNLFAQTLNVLDPYATGTPLTRMMDKMANFFTKANALGYILDFIQDFSGQISHHMMIDQVFKMAKTGQMPKSRRNKLLMSFAGIDTYGAKLIADSITRFGKKDNGLWIARTQDWDDPYAVELFRTALAALTDSGALRKNKATIPLWFNSNVGSVIGQFRNFIFESHEKIFLPSIQQRDAAVIFGVVAMTGIGMMVEGFIRWASGKEMPETYGELALAGAKRTSWATVAMSISNAIDMSGVPWVNEAVTGKAVTDYQRKQYLLGLLGPSMSGMIDAGTVAGAASDLIFREKAPTASQYKAFMRLFPFQNYLLFRQLFQSILDELPKR